MVTCSLNKARIGARSENRLLLKSEPASAKTKGIRAAKTDAPKSRDGVPNIFSQPGRAEGAMVLSGRHIGARFGGRAV